MSDKPENDLRNEIKSFTIKLPQYLYAKMERICLKESVIKFVVLATLLDRFDESTALNPIPRFTLKSTQELSKEYKQRNREKIKAKREEKKQKEKDPPKTEKPVLRNYVDLSRYNK